MVLIERGDEEVLTTQVDCSNQGMCRRSSKERGEEKSDGGVVFWSASAVVGGASELAKDVARDWLKELPRDEKGPLAIHFH